MLANEIVEHGLKLANQHAAADIRIGLGYTAVRLEDGSCGLAYTLLKMLILSKRAREIAILGPSTPFLPEIFSRYGVTILSGLQVADSTQVLRIVSEGGGTRQFLRAVRKLSLRCLAQ